MKPVQNEKKELEKSNGVICQYRVIVTNFKRIRNPDSDRFFVTKVLYQ